ncbi:hypothetical protein GUJ93_ZPchr0007g4059 [Zizania palustris]|nr:hypothetical protein GUJ93_ZPchr0007g4059 [Zizania palustris]
MTTRCARAGVEDVVRRELKAVFANDATLRAGLLRLHFHDCFVRGCDVYIMLNSHNATAEKDADPNLTVRGYEAIEVVKAKVEAACPFVVSCADIMAMAARDAVYFSDGPHYEVETGRRDDGNVSINVTDPSLDPAYAKQLAAVCKRGNVASVEPMDPLTPVKFDNGYYKSVAGHRALLASDAALLDDDSLTGAYVRLLTNDTNQDTIFADFSVSMINMGRVVAALTGTDGQIRGRAPAASSSTDRDYFFFPSFHQLIVVFRINQFVQLL